MDFVSGIVAPSHEAGGAGDVSHLPEWVQDLWPKCHPSIRSRWLETVVEVSKAVPDFDINRLVAPSGSLHATALKLVHYPTYKCSADNLKFDYVKDAQNPSIWMTMKKAGIEKTEDDDTCSMNMYPVRVMRAQIDELGLQGRQHDEAWDAPYNHLVDDAVLRILRKFCNWAGVESKSKVVEIYGENGIRFRSASSSISWCRRGSGNSSARDSVS